MTAIDKGQQILNLVIDLVFFNHWNCSFEDIKLLG